MWTQFLLISWGFPFLSCPWLISPVQGNFKHREPNFLYIKLTISQGCRHWFVFYISRLLWSINYINTHNYQLFQNINTQVLCEQDTIFPSLCPNYLEFLIRYKLLSAKDKLFYFTTWKINLNLGTRSSLTHWLHPLPIIMFAFLILSLMNKLAWSSTNWSHDFEIDSQVLFHICPIPIHTCLSPDASQMQQPVSDGLGRRLVLQLHRGQYVQWTSPNVTDTERMNVHQILD